MMAPKKIDYYSYEQYTEFKPIQPIKHDGFVVQNRDNHRVVLWDTMQNKDINALLPNHNSFVSVEKIESSGELKYSTSGISYDAGSYNVYFDYIKYRIEDYKKYSIEGQARIGVGLRIKASVSTFKANINIGTPIGLALAAKEGSLRGNLSIDVIGVDSKDIGLLIPMPSEINEISIQNAIQALASIKSKIYDSSTHMVPHIVAIRKDNLNDSTSIIDNKIKNLNLFNSMHILDADRVNDSFKNEKPVSEPSKNNK